MPNFLLSRIAVNLLLIVVMAIQPVAVCWAQGSCGDGVTRSHGVQGCACCGDKDTSDCCCQAKPAGDPAESNAESNAEGARAQDSRKQGSRTPGCCVINQGGQGNARPVEDKRDTDLVENVLATTVAVNGDARLRAICLCGIESHPLSDTMPRRGTNNVQDSSALIAFDLDESLSDRRRPLSTRFEEVRAVVPAHFSQLHLCVWRL